MSEQSFVIIDDDLVAADIQRLLLEKQGHKVQVSLDASSAVEFVSRVRPEILLIDIMMPNIDGLEVVRRLRLVPELRGLKIIVVSSKSYQADRDRALAMGADGMLLKPVSPASFVDEVLALASNNIDITYWGLRGTLPVPGRRTLRYGGNTTCVSLEMPRGNFFIFDAGSGIRELSRHVMATRNGALSAKIFISHPHWDHLNALPHFVPLYIAENEFEIMGPGQGALTMREMVAAQFDSVYAPIPLRNFGARVRYRNLSEEEITVGDAKVRTLLLAHPGNCLGYRVTLGERSFCFVTDSELYVQGTPGHDPAYIEKLTEFVRGADVLLTDVTYSDAQHKARVNWGHSGVSEIVGVADAAGVRELQLMQHDPEQTDDDIDAKLAEARDVIDSLGSATVCTAPAELTRRRLTSSGTLIELGPVE
jgi:CheY-like chemotaxis protein/phosphoribosyl 1,2-cyclic phosphodiesterase